MWTACGKRACSTTTASLSPSSTLGGTVQVADAPLRRKCDLQIVMATSYLAHSEFGLSRPQRCHSPNQALSSSVPSSSWPLLRAREFVHPFGTEFNLNSHYPTFLFARSWRRDHGRTETLSCAVSKLVKCAIQSAPHKRL